MEAHIACFQKRPSSDLTLLTTLISDVSWVIAAQTVDSSGSVQQDSVVCTLHPGPDGELPLLLLRDCMVDQITEIIRAWAGPNVPTILVRYSEKPAPRQTKAILA